MFRLAVSVLVPLFLAFPPYRSTLSLGSPATRPTPSLFQLCETLSNGGARLAACIPGASKPGPIRLHTNAEDGELEFIIHFLTRRDLSLFLVLRVLLLEFLPSSSLFFFFHLAKVEHRNDHFPPGVRSGMVGWFNEAIHACSNVQMIILLVSLVSMINKIVYICWMETNWIF